MWPGVSIVTFPSDIPPPDGNSNARVGRHRKNPHLLCRREGAAPRYVYNHGRFSVERTMRWRLWLSLAWLLLASLTAWADSKQMASEVTIYRDHYGVPHVFGHTDASTVFGFAYAQAEDNFPRLEENFVLALGRGSELYGETLLKEDQLNRTLEVERRAREDYEQGSPKVRELCRAFADGVNFYLHRH